MKEYTRAAKPKSFAHVAAAGVQGAPAAPDGDDDEDIAAMLDNMCTMDEDDGLTLSLREALEGEDAQEWQAAIDKEFAQFHAQGVFSFQPLPAGQSVLHHKILCRWKCDAKGKKLGRKARVVCCGWAQKPNQYGKTFAPVSRAESVRSVVAVAAARRFKLNHLDASSAFLSSPLEETISIRAPVGYVGWLQRAGHITPQEAAALEGMHVLLQRSIYGLRQASRAWFSLVRDVMHASGFTRLSGTDECVFQATAVKDTASGKTVKGVFLVALTVDDFVCAVENPKAIRVLLSNAAPHFTLNDLGTPSRLLGMRVEQKHDTITLSQPAHIHALIQKLRLHDAHPVSTPCVQEAMKLWTSQASSDAEGKEKRKNAEEAGDAKERDEDEAGVDPKKQAEIVKHYKSALGSLLYLSTWTHPEISFPVNVLARFSNAPRKCHWIGLKRVVRYLMGAADQGVSYHFANDGVLRVQGFCDSDYSNCVKSRKSQTGFVFTINGSPIAWCSRRQEVVSLSSTEAELIALTAAAQEAVWVERLFSQLQCGYVEKSLTLYCDNQPSIYLAQSDATFHSRTKHIDTRYYWVRDLLASKIFTLKHIQGAVNPADIFTKGVSAPLFARHVRALSLHH